MQILNGKMLRGRPLHVDLAATKEEVAARKAASRSSHSKPDRRNRTEGCSIFIGNLSFDMDEDTLKEMVDDIVGPGLFTSINLPVERDSGQVRGFAHVNFRDEATAQRAVQELDGVQVLDRVMRATLSYSQQDRMRSAASGDMAHDRR